MSYLQQNLKVAKVIDFTLDQNPIDNVGHGTVISSIIGSRNPSCPGIAPDAELYIFRLFNDKLETYTEWLLDAFNFILDHDIDIVNLSNGSSDYLDEPFNDKIHELTANGIIVVASIGNEGPFQGTINNPGDLIDVIGVGSHDQTGTKTSQFSSRGMTTN